MLTKTQSAAVPQIRFVGDNTYDRRGYYRSPVTQRSYRLGKSPANKGMKLPPEVLSPEEVLALINACGRGRAGRRNRALIMVLWRCGLRVSETLDLMPKDVGVQRGEIRVLHGKGNKSRIVALDPAAGAMLERWEVERRELLGLDGTKPYFCVISHPNVGERINSSYVRELMKRLQLLAGVEKRCHPHGLRHTYASYLLDQGVPIEHISIMLGHNSIATTVRYLRHINPRKSLEHARAVAWPDLSLVNS